MTQEIRIDATNQILGRLASKIALFLRGKDLPGFMQNTIPNRKIVITNVEKLKVTGNKLKQKTYVTHSGHPGHIKTKVLREVMQKDPGRVLEWAVYGMLPKNKLRAKMMQHLVIHV